jgi:hypothetical protein
MQGLFPTATLITCRCRLLHSVSYSQFILSASAAQRSGSRKKIRFLMYRSGINYFSSSVRIEVLRMESQVHRDRARIHSKTYKQPQRSGPEAQISGYIPRATVLSCPDQARHPSSHVRLQPGMSIIPRAPVLSRPDQTSYNGRGWLPPGKYIHPKRTRVVEPISKRPNGHFAAAARQVHSFQEHP